MAWCCFVHIYALCFSQGNRYNYQCRLFLPESGSGVTSLLRLESLSRENSLLVSGFSLCGDSLIAGGGGESGGGGGINIGGFCCTALVLGVTMPISGASSAND